MTDLDDRCDSPLKVFFHPVDATGHINSCIGLAQTMQNRGHRIYFLSNQSFKGKFSKYGFTEILLKDDRQLVEEQEKPKEKKSDDEPEQPPVNPIKMVAAQLMESGFLSNKTPLEKLKEMNDNDNKVFMDELCNKSIAYNDQIKEAIEREKPDLLVVDNFFVEPGIMHSGLPWIMLFSGAPLYIYESDQLPPFSSGLSINDDRTKWEDFKGLSNKFAEICNEKQNEMLKHFNYPELESGTHITMSPYLNIYGYPEELDYHDVVPRPEKIFGVDAFCRKMPQPFEFPVEFKNKIKPGDKLVYVSLGSMGSFNIELMKRLVEILGKTPHKYVISKGPLHDEFELADNMWGEEYVPQTSILPLMDLVITHGGNNSVTETFSFGKPMIVMPLFGDQVDNAQRIQDKGFGVRMHAHEYTEQELVDTVNRLLNDTELKQRLSKISQRIQQSKSKDKACIKIEKIVEQFATNKQ